MAKSQSVVKTTAKKGTRGNHLKAKLLSAYYGHPLKDMKLICITGSTGKPRNRTFCARNSQGKWRSSRNFGL